MAITADQLGIEIDPDTGKLAFDPQKDAARRDALTQHRAEFIDVIRKLYRGYLSDTTREVAVDPSVTTGIPSPRQALSAKSASANAQLSSLGLPENMNEVALLGLQSATSSYDNNIGVAREMIDGSVEIPGGITKDTVGIDINMRTGGLTYPNNLFARVNLREAMNSESGQDDLRKLLTAHYTAFLTQGDPDAAELERRVNSAAAANQSYLDHLRDPKNQPVFDMAQDALSQVHEARKAALSAETDPAAPSRTGTAFSQDTLNFQSLCFFAQAGGYEALANSGDITCDGHSGRSTGNMMKLMTGKTTAELNAMTPADVVTIIEQKMQVDHALRDAVLKGLRDNIESHPDQVKAYLHARGFMGADLNAAIDEYGYSRGIGRPNRTAASAAEISAEPFDRYAGINFDEETAMFQNSDGNWERHYISGQTQGIRDKDNLKPFEEKWYEDVGPGTQAARDGVLIADDGKVYILLENNGELTKCRIDPFVKEHGLGPFTGLPFLTSGPDAYEIQNCFEAARELPNFVPEIGVLLNGKNGVHIRVTEYGAELIGMNDGNAVFAQSQTPPAIRDAWYKTGNNFNNLSAVRDIVQESGFRIPSYTPEVKPSPETGVTAFDAALNGSADANKIEVAPLGPAVPAPAEPKPAP